jgi:hypothetical protein
VRRNAVPTCEKEATAHRPPVSPLMIPLVYGHIKKRQMVVEARGEGLTAAELFYSLAA